MLHYPKIPGSKDAPSGQCTAFEKLDGTNLHWCWDRELGWHAFGTRRDEFNLTSSGIAAFAFAHPGLEDAERVVLETLANPLEDIFRQHPSYRDYNSIKVFTEYLGPHSFAGRHQDRDRKENILFDVLIEGRGLVIPEAFVSDFGHLPIPRIIYRGKLTGSFLESVRDGKWGVTEGVVCKGTTDSGEVWMVKIKTYSYLQRLKAVLGAKWEEYWE